MSKHRIKTSLILISFIIFSIPIFVYAHCDTLKGPVVMDARKALESGKIAPVLKWIRETDEPEVSRAFQKVQDVRQLNKDAKDLAEFYFFETVVRLHRASEGATYSGISTEEIEPIILEADKAISNGSMEDLSKIVTSEIVTKLRQKFGEVIEKKKNADDSAKAGREYVKAYVEFVHFVEYLNGGEQSESNLHE